MRSWREKDHPRDQEGQFREKTGGRWAQQISDRIGLPSLQDILKGPHNTSYNEAATQLEGSYGSGGMRVEDASIHRVGGDYLDAFRPEYGGHIDIGGAIVSDDPESRDGYFRMSVSHGPDDLGGPSKWKAHLDRMHVRGSAQGGGGGRELTDRLIDWARQSGVDEITVGPSEIGSYAWGAMGFDFEDFESRRIAWEGAMTMSVDAVQDHFRRQADHGWGVDPGLTDAAVKKMISQYRRAATRAGAGLMSYQKLSQVGRKPGQGKDDWWAGKLGLIIGGVGGGRIKL